MVPEKDEEFGCRIARTGWTFQSGEIVSGYFEGFPFGTYVELFPIDSLFINTERRSGLIP